jgi:hypothetical protein
MVDALGYSISIQFNKSLFCVFLSLKKMKQWSISNDFRTSLINLLNAIYYSVRDSKDVTLNNTFPSYPVIINKLHLNMAENSLILWIRSSSK